MLKKVPKKVVHFFIGIMGALAAVALLYLMDLSCHYLGILADKACAANMYYTHTKECGVAVIVDFFLFLIFLLFCGTLAGVIGLITDFGKWIEKSWKEISGNPSSEESTIMKEEAQ